MEPVVDYVASIQWMWYRNEWAPRLVSFVSTYDLSDVLTVAPAPDSLCQWTFKDILKNRDLPEDPFQTLDVTHACQQSNLKPFLAHSFYKDVLMPRHGNFEVQVGAADMATFMYLKSVLPHVEYVGLTSHALALKGATRQQRSRP